MAFDDVVGGGFDPKSAIDDLIRQQDGQGQSTTSVQPDVLANRLYRKLQQRQASEPDDVAVKRPTNLKPKQDAPDFSDQGVPLADLPDFASQGTPIDQVKAAPPAVSLGATGQAKAALKGIPHGAIDQAGGILKGAAIPINQAQPYLASLEYDPYGNIIGQKPVQPAAPVAQHPLYRAGQATQDFANRVAPMSDQEKDSIGGRIGQGIGGVAPYLAAGVVNPALGVVAGAGGMAASTAADTFDAAVAKGASEEQAAAAAGYGALIGGALGAVPLGMVLKPIRLVGPKFAGVAAGYLEEAVKSGVTFATVGEAQEYLLQKVAKDFYDPQAGYSPDAKRIIASLVTGGVLGAGGHFMERRSARAAAAAPPPEAEVAAAGPPPSLSGPSAGAGPEPGSATPGGEPPPGGPAPGGAPPRPEAERSGVGREKLEKILRYYGYSAEDIAAMSHAEMADAVLKGMKGHGPKAKPAEQAAPEQPQQPKAEAKPQEQPRASTEQAEFDGLKRHGWTDEEISQMGPAQRRREFQSAMETGQSEPQSPKENGTKPAEQPKPEEPPVAAAPASGTTFTTAKGSTYEVHDDGTTTRNKAARPDVGHEGDEGPKERSAKTVYVTGAQMGGFGAPQNARWRVIDHDNGTMSLATWNEAQGKWGIAPSMRNIEVSDKPSIGSHPIELWKPEKVYGRTAYSAMHPGNVITKLESANGKDDARNGRNSGTSGVEAHQGTVQQPKGRGVQELRSEGDQNGAGMGEQLSRVPGAHRTETESENDAGPEGQQQGVRAGKSPVGDASRAVGKSTPRSDGDDQWRDAERNPSLDKAGVVERSDQTAVSSGNDVSGKDAGTEKERSSTDAAGAKREIRDSDIEKPSTEAAGASAMTPDEFQKWLAGDTTKPLKEGQTPLDAATRSDILSAEATAASTAVPTESPLEAASVKGSTSATRPSANRSSEPLSLLQFIASKGGVAPHAELKALDLAGGHRVQIPGRSGFFGVVRPTGMPLDMMREAAEEAGYFRGEHNKTSTVRDLLDAIDTELRGGRHTAEGEEGAQTKRQRASSKESSDMAREKAIAAAREDIAAEYQEAPDDVLDRAAEIMADERLDIDSAVEMAAVRMVAEDADYGVSAQDMRDIYGEDTFDAIQRQRPSENGRAPAGERSQERGSGQEEEAGRNVAPAVDHGEARGEKAPRGRGQAPVPARLTSKVVDAYREGVTELTSAGEQRVLPGAEKIGQGEQAQRAADKPLKPAKAQKPADEGLFGDESKQGDLLDRPRLPKMETLEVYRAMGAIEKALGADAERVPPVDIARAAEIMAESPGMEPETAFGQAVIKNAVEQGFITEQEAVDAYGEEVRELLEPEREGAPVGGTHAVEGRAASDKVGAGGATEDRELSRSGKTGAQQGEASEEATAALEAIKRALAAPGGDEAAGNEAGNAAENQPAAKDAKRVVKPYKKFTQADLIEAQAVYKEAEWRTKQEENNASHERFAAEAKAKLDEIERALAAERDAPTGRGPLAREVAPHHLPWYDKGYRGEPRGGNESEQAAWDRGYLDSVNAGKKASPAANADQANWWDRELTAAGRQQAIDKAGLKGQVINQSLWHYIKESVRNKLLAVRGEVSDGVQAGVSPGDEAAGPGDVQSAEPGGQATGAGKREGSAGERAVRGTDEGRAEGTGRVSEGAVREPSDRGRDADTDRLSESRADDAAGRREKRATERAANLVEGENHSIEPGSLDETRGPKAKAIGNLEALELANRILAEDRPATAAEQQILARYVGWGGLKNVFPDAQGNFSDDMYATLGERLKAALSAEEYATARRSIQYAHYTSENIVRSMWDAVGRMGFQGGQVFEPGMGVGNFAGMMPADVAARSHYHGVELDHTTARIAKLLYPKYGVRQDDFTKVMLPENTYDLVIGNPPFADIAIKSDPKYRQGFLLHDYFFAKSLDAVRPGGLLAFVTTAGTMNKGDPAARQYLADRADLVGAIRLPGGAFEKNAGTKVTTDIIFLRKRLPADVAGNRGWIGSRAVGLPNKSGMKVTGNVSSYFLDHPEMVLGEQGFFDPLYENRYAVRARPDQDLKADIAAAIERLPQDVMSDWQDVQAEGTKADFSTTEKKEGTYYVGPDGRLHQVSGGVGQPVRQRGKGVENGRTGAEIERITALVPIRDALRQVYAADLAADAPNAARAREALNRHYDAFVEKFGPINKAVIQTRRPNVIQMEGERAAAREEVRYADKMFREGTFDARRLLAEKTPISVIARQRQEMRADYERRGLNFDEGDFDENEVPDVIIDKRPNVDAFMDDPESYRLRAIERYDEGTGKGHKSPVFFENIITREKPPEIHSTNDALLYSLSKFGRVNLPEMAQQLKKSPDEVLEALGDQVFQVPGTTDTHETRDEYLSGNVRKKLTLAKKAAERNSAFRRNVDALEAAQPIPLAPSQIHATLGMPWMPQETVQQFGMEALGLEKLSVRYLAPLAQWVVSGDTDSVSASSTWGTTDRRAPALIQDALNRQTPKIYDKHMIDGRETSTLNIAKTEAAHDKIRAIQEKFSEWIWEDQGRADELAGMYNEKFNNLVVRGYDGSYLTTPGISSTWSWRPHQKRVIARIIQSGNTYIAHAVGSGKTSTYIGAIMEMRRLGLVRKPMVAVPNHVLGQFTKEWYEQYPMAKLAIADDRQFHTDRRKQFVANVAMGDLDAVIITHSAFGMIPVSDRFQNGLIEEQLNQYRELMSQLSGPDNRITRSRVEKQIERLEQRLQGKGTKRKDSVFTFEEMGIDHLTVDEMHIFRKLDFSTQMSNLKGISPEGSAMAWDLYVKTQYLDRMRPGRSLVLGSGTPITNTMAELFTVQRFMQPQTLEERGIDKFDAWAGAFGESVSELEQDAAGNYKPVSRFAKFVNVADLSAMVRQFMDVVTSKQLEQYVTRPQIAGGKRQMHLAEKSPELENYQEKLAQRMLAIQKRKGPPAKGDDIMLTVINDGRHAAIDMRLAGGSATNMPSKLDMMVDNVFQRWQETKKQPLHRPADGGGYEKKPAFHGPATQLVFVNLGLSGARGFAVPDYIRAELVRRGVPKNEIAYIYDFKSQTAKQRLFNDMNEGKIRVLIGSVAKMGVGTNVQRRLSDIHNMDPLWYPADDEQRNGRGIRQGNMNPEIGIHDYSTKGTYDSTMWGMMAKKAKFIQGFFEGDPSLREMDDLGEASQYEQAKALTTNDPRLILFTELKQDLERAQRRKTAFDSELYATRQRRADAKSSLEHYTARIKETKADIAQRVETTGEEFKAKLGRKTYDVRAEFGEAVIARMADMAEKGVKNTPVHIGEIGGFQVWGEIKKSHLREGESYFTDVWLQMNGDRRRDIGSDTPRGIVQSMEANIRRLPDDLHEYEARLLKAKKFLTESESKVNARFEGQAEIDRLTRAVRDMEAQLKGGPDLASKIDVPTAPLKGISPEKIERLKALLESAVRRLAGKEVKVEFNEGALHMPDAPGYRPGSSNKAVGGYRLGRDLILLALIDDPGRMLQGAAHEAYHHIEARLQTDQERDLMKRETERMREWIKGKILMNDYQIDGLAGYEVRAIAFSQYAYSESKGKAGSGASAGKPNSGLHMMVRQWFDRLMHMLRQIANGIRGLGFKTYEDIFSEAYEGKFGERKMNDGIGIDLKNMAAGWDAFSRSQDDLINGRIKDLMQSTVADRFVERYQNLSKPVQRLQEAVEAKLSGTLPDSQAFYTKKRLFPGKVGVLVQDFNKAHLDPLIKTAREAGLSLPDVGDILYALHAPERNAAMEEINHPALDGSDKDVIGRRSGMSDEEAAAILAKHDPAVVKKLDGMVNAIRDFNLDMQVQSGLLSSAQADAYREKYEHYVPLSGWDVAPEDQDQNKFQGGGAFNVRGKETKRAFGRKSKAQNPLINVLEQSYRTIERSKKNEYLRSARSALGALEPDQLKGFVRFDRGKPTKAIDPMTGLVREVEDPFYRNEPGAVGYKIGGNQHYMIFDNKDLGEAIKRMHADGLGMFQPLLNIQNKLKSLWTHWSPDFLVRHFLFRYPIEGTLNSFEQKESGDHSISQYIKAAVPFLGSASRAIFATNKGVAATGEAAEMQRYWREMRAAGGSMAFRDMRDTDTLREHLESKLSSLNRSTWQSLNDKHRAVVEAMDTVTNALDNSLRLAAFASARRQGKTPEQSALIAREATVDFQLAGKWKNAIGLWFPFGNIAIQTGIRMTGAMARSRIMRRVFMGTLLAGFMAGAYNYLVGGDDQDGVPFFDKIPEWDRHLNFIVMSPAKDGKGRPIPLKIPMPYNWAFPFTIGSAFATMIFGKDKHRMREMLGLVTKAGIEVATPFGQEANTAAMLAPELARPIVHVATNRNWNGAPVHQDETFQKGPNSYSGRKTTGDGWKYIAQGANDLTGGDKRHAGTLDFYPEDLRLLFDYIGGTQRRLMENLAMTGSSLGKGEGPDLTYFPLARVVMGTDYDQSDKMRRFKRLHEERQPWKR